MCKAIFRGNKLFVLLSTRKRKEEKRRIQSEMGNPGIANLCQDARGGEFGQANLANPELESTFFIAIAILRGV